MTEMPEPVAAPRQPFLPHAGHFATEIQTFAQQLQTLKQLSVPNANIYLALSSEQPVTNLVETFQSATGEIDRWLENANSAITTLELDVREGASVKNVSEMDVLIHTFVPNIELFQDLAQAILDHYTTPEDEQRRGEVTDTKERLHNDWLDVKSYFGKVKKEISESKQRRELLDTMDQIITSIEELQTSIFEYQEQRHNGFASGADGEPFPVPKLSSSPTSRSRPLTPAHSSELSQRSEIALMQLDSRMEPLSARIEYLRSRLSAKNAPSDPTGTLAKKHKSLSDKWDTLRREMESLREELKEVGWLSVFKQVSGQANQMMDSLERVVRQCKDFYARVLNRSDSPLPPRLLQQQQSPRGSRYNQRGGPSRDSPQPIQPPMQLTQKNFQRLFKNFDAKRKYYVPAVTKMLTMLGNGINNQMTKDVDAIKKYKQMKERWDSILDGVSEVQRDMPHLEQIMESALVASNSPPSSIPSSIASSPPVSPPMRPARGMFSPESGSPPRGARPLSPYRRVVSPGDRDRSLSPSHNNARSPSLRSKSPSPRAMSPLGRSGYLAPNGRRSVSPSRELDRQWNYDHPRYSQQYSPHYAHGNSYHRSVSPQPHYDRGSGRTKSASRPESPIRPQSARPMSPAASAIPRPVTSMGITGRSISRAGMRSFIPQPSTPAPGMMSRISMSSPTPTSPRRGQALRSPTPNSSDNLRPSTPDSDDDDEDDDDDDSDDNDGRMTPLSATLNRMSLTGEHPPYVAVKNDPLDVEVAKVVNDSVIPVKVERAPGGGGKYYFGQEGNGQTRKMYLCRLMDYSRTGHSKVMVRVGGGWQDLDMFLLNHGLMGNISVKGFY